MSGVTFDALKVGDAAEISQRITEQDVRNFAEISGDFNKVHRSTSLSLAEVILDD